MDVQFLRNRWQQTGSVDRQHARAEIWQAMWQMNRKADS
jgi:hypothetical protein